MRTLGFRPVNCVTSMPEGLVHDLGLATWCDTDHARLGFAMELSRGFNHTWVWVSIVT